MTLVLTAWLFAAPPLPEVADADAMAWVHVPQLGTSLRALAISRFAGLAQRLLPEDVREALARPSGAELLAASYRSPQPGQADVILWLDAGSACATAVPMMERWLGQQGFVADAGRSKKGGVSCHALAADTRTMTVFTGSDRCGWTSDAARAERVLLRAGEPLAAEPAFAGLATRASDVRARLDVQRFYGLLARTARGPRLAGQIQRLGLAGARALELVASLRGKRELRAEVRLVMDTPFVDLPAALGPPIVHERPGLVPGSACSQVRVSVRPMALWLVAVKMLDYHRPVESALARAQLDAVEQRLGKRLETGLGEMPRAWTWWSTAAGWVLHAEVADATLIATLLAAYAEVLPGIFPELAVSRHLAGERQVVALMSRGRTLVAVGADDGALVVASTLTLAKSALVPRRGRTTKLGDTPVVAHGRHVNLGDTFARLFPGIAGALAGVGLGGSWELRQSDKGFVVGAAVRDR